MNRLRVRYRAEIERQPDDGPPDTGRSGVEVLDADGDVLGLLPASCVRFEHRARERPVLILELPVRGLHEANVDTDL